MATKKKSTTSKVVGATAAAGTKAASSVKSTIKSAAKTAAKTVAAAATYSQMDKLLSEMLTEVGKSARVQIFGLGPGDEALYKIAKTHLTVDQRERINQFERNLKDNGYSVWWFRNVIAAMQETKATIRAATTSGTTRRGSTATQTQQASATDERGVATEALRQIAEKETFAEQIVEAGSDLIKKSIVCQASRGWEIIKGKGKELFVAFDPSVINQKDYKKLAKDVAESVSDFLGDQADEICEGFNEGLTFNRSGRIILLVIGLLLAAFFLAMYIGLKGGI